MLASDVGRPRYYNAVPALYAPRPAAMTRLRTIDATRLATARRLLNERQYLVWAMAEAGVSRQAIADHLGRSKGSVNDMVRRARRIIDNAEEG